MLITHTFLLYILTNHLPKIKGASVGGMNTSRTLNLASLIDNASISLKDYYLGYVPQDTSHIIDSKVSPYLVILQNNNYPPINNYVDSVTPCDPQAFIEILVTLLNLFCYLPGYCYDNNNSTISNNKLPNLNITSADVIWKWYSAGSSKMYMKFLVLRPDNSPTLTPYVNRDQVDSHKFIPTFVIQSVLSRMNDIIEARLGCHVINPLKTSYTYAFWVMPLIAGILFMLLLSAVILVYHVWDPRIEQKFKAKWLHKEEGTKLIHNFTVIPEGLEEMYTDSNPHIPAYKDSNVKLKETEDSSNGGDNTRELSRI